MNMFTILSMQRLKTIRSIFLLSIKKTDLFNFKILTRICYLYNSKLNIACLQRRVLKKAIDKIMTPNK